MLTWCKSQRDKLLYIDKIEAFTRRNSALKHQEQEEGESSSNFSIHTTHSATFIMAEEVYNPSPARVVLGDYVIPQGPRNRSAIVLSSTAQQMEIKPYWYNLILTNQFTGKDNEDPHNFLETFYDLIATMGLDEASAKDDYMKLFHLAPIEDAKELFKTISSQSLNTWSEVEEAFLTRLFPPSKMIQV
jgi:hypothetical protein